MNILEVSHLNKSFKKKRILRDVSFSLNEGEILGFIGPNGAGKTTTIKLILGLQSIDSGKVIIDGYDVKKDFEKAIANVGAIVESPDMYMYLSGYQNLEMIARMYKGIGKNRIDEVVKLVGLEARIRDKVSKYSLGMRQRLGIAAALIHNPKLLVLDEPTNGLDPEGIKDLRNLLKKLVKEEKIGVLISSHNLAELESFCTNVCIIQNGVIVETGVVKDIKRTEVPNYIITLDKVDNVEKIRKDIKINGNSIFISDTKENIGDFITDLVKKGYKVYEAKQIEMSLEDAFLKKTGGNKID